MSKWIAESYVGAEKRKWKWIILHISLKACQRWAERVGHAIHTHHLLSVDITKCCVSEKYADEMNMQKPDTERYPESKAWQKQYLLDGRITLSICVLCLWRCDTLYKFIRCKWCTGRPGAETVTAYGIFLLSCAVGISCTFIGIMMIQWL